MARAVLQLPRELVEQRQHERFFVDLTLLRLACRRSASVSRWRWQRLRICISAGSASSIGSDGTDRVQAQTDAAFERGSSAQQLEAERALARAPSTLNRPASTWPRILNTGELPPNSASCWVRSTRPIVTRVSTELFASEQTIDIRVLAFDRHRDEVREDRTTRRRVAIKHLARLRRATAFRV